MGWRRVLDRAAPPAARRAAEPRPRGPPATPRATATPSTSGSSARSCAAATAGACPPAARRASASAPTTRASTSARPPTRSPRASTPPAVRYQGNWFPHRLRAADRRRCPLRGRQRRALLPALGRGHPHRVLLRHRGRARAARRARGRRRPASGRWPTTRPSTTRHAPAFRRALRLQRLVPALPPRVLTARPAGAGRAAAGRSRVRLVPRAGPSAAGWHNQRLWRSPTTSAASSRSSSRTGGRGRC